MRGEQIVCLGGNETVCGEEMVCETLRDCLFEW